MGGQISVISKVGKGSTFTFTLRCKRPSLVKGGPSVVKLVSETKMKKNLSNSTAHVHKLQAGMSYPSSKSRKAIANLQTSNKILEEEREARTPRAEVTAPKFSSKSPRSSLKLLKWNDCDCNGLLGGAREKSKSWEQEMYVYTTSWAARQGGLKENNSGDRCGVLQETFRGGLRRTSSGPSRFECLMMADLDHSKSMPAIPFTAPTVDKKLPSLLLAEDNKVSYLENQGSKEVTLVHVYDCICARGIQLILFSDTVNLHCCLKLQSGDIFPSLRKPVLEVDYLIFVANHF